MVDFSKIEKEADELRKKRSLYRTFCDRHVGGAQSYGSAVAVSLFVMMLNPKYRGGAFTWDKLEDMAAGQAATGAFMNYTPSVWARYGPLIQEAAVESSRHRVRELLEDSGVETWLPLTE